jgi:hypothetical protein
MHEANTLQALISVKAWQQVYHQVANTNTNPSQMESNQKWLGLIYDEFPNQTYHEKSNLIP